MKNIDLRNRMNIKISELLRTIKPYSGPEFEEVLTDGPVVNVKVQNRTQMATLLGFLKVKGYYRPSGTCLLQWLDVYGEGKYTDGLSIYPSAGQVYVDRIGEKADYMII